MGKINKVAMLYVGTSLDYFGFRKIVGIAAKKHESSMYTVFHAQNVRSLASVMRGGDAKTAIFSAKDFEDIADELGKADLVAVSSMSRESKLVKQILSAVKKRHPETFLLWGGVHTIVDPEDAINSDADAICTGEGEEAFTDFLGCFEEHEKLLSLENFWFRTENGVIKNPCRRLLKNEELDEYPWPCYLKNEYVFENGRGFRASTDKDYVTSHALAYNTIWTRGCPFKCTYCSNNIFIERDKEAAQIRYPSVDYVISEIKSVLRAKPFIQYINFHDDCCLSINLETLKAFKERWLNEIGLPFTIYGVTPTFVDEEKLRVLVQAGMVRLRMGVQSGSDRILKFYKRPNKNGLIQNAINIISRIQTKNMLPPSYDIILDNPIENEDDVRATLRFVNNMPRPFALNVFSLRFIPNTPLEKQLKELALEGRYLENSNFGAAAPTLANILLYWVATFHMPDKLLERLLVYALPFHVKQSRCPRLMTLVKLIFYINKGYQHLRHLNFSLIFGQLGWALWKLGFIKRPKLDTTQQERA